MFFRVFLTELKISLRTKVYMFWAIIFPIALGTLFYACFNSIYSNQQTHAIPIAILEDEPSYMFTKMVLNLRYEGGEAMIQVVDVDDEAEANKLLEANEITAIMMFDAYGNVKMQIKENGIDQSILSHIVGVYNQKKDLAQYYLSSNDKNPDWIDILELMQVNEFIEKRGLTGDNNDPYVFYFYNLIAMICLMGGVAGNSAVGHAQAFQAEQGKRIDVSPVNKFVYEMAVVASVYSIQVLVVCLALTYYIYVLGINFASNTPMVYIIAIVSTLIGVAEGYMIGHIKGLSSSVKDVIVMVVMLGGNFLSGLMVGEIKSFIAEKCPIVNKINPSAIITDAYYSLNVFGMGNRLYTDLLLLVVVSLVLFIVGIILAFGRRGRINESL